MRRPRLTLPFRTRSFLLLFFLGAAGLVAGIASTSFAQSGDVYTRLAPRDASPCIAEGKKSLTPGVLLLGEQTTVTVHANASCEGLGLPLHGLLVLDGSNSMGLDDPDDPSGRTKSESMKTAAQQMVRRMKLGDHPFKKVGVIEFREGANLRADLTNRESRVISAISGIRAEGGTAIDKGIELGMRTLTTARDTVDVDEESIREYMIVVSDGGASGGCGPVMSAANRAQGMGIEMFSVCIGRDCVEDSCMRQIASTPAHYYWAEYSNYIGAILERIRQKAYEPTKLREIHIVDTLPVNMRFVPGSAASEPIGLDFSKVDSVLTWESRLPPDIGITVTYQIQPLQAGLHPVSQASIVRFWDDQRGEGALALESPSVLVLDPVGVSSATPTSTAIPTTTPLPTETPLPIATLTATATRVPDSTYLPVALN